MSLARFACHRRSRLSVPWEFQDEPCPGLAGLHVEVSGVGSADLACDGKPQPGAAAGTGPALIEADEAFEDSLTISIGDTGAVVLDLDTNGAAVHLEPQLYPGAGVPSGIVGEVPQGTAQVRWVALDARGRGVDRDGDGARSAEAGGFGEKKVIQVEVDGS